MYPFKRKMIKGVSSILAMVLVFSIVNSGFASANEAPINESSETDGLPLQNQKGILSAPLSSDQALMNYMTTNKSALGLNDPKEQLQLSNKTVDSYGGTHYLYQLQHDGVPVYGKYMRVHLNPKKRVSEIRNEMTSSDLPLMPTTTSPKLSGRDAIKVLKAELETKLGQSIPEDQTINGASFAPENQASLIIYPYQGRSYLAYEIVFNYLVPAPGRWVAYVDALKGTVIDKYNSIDYAQSPATIVGKGKGRDSGNVEIDVNRILEVVLDDDFDDVSVANSVYFMEDRTRDMYNSTTNKGVIRTYDYLDPVIRPVTVPTSSIDQFDFNAVNVQFYTGFVYEYFKNKHNRNSIDDNGMNLVSIVNYEEIQGENYENTFWDGSYMFYGNGYCYTCALDLIGHELTHGITQYTSGLEYRHQSGALNESFSDIFGNLIEMEYKGTDNWLINEDSGNIYRDMSNPGAYGHTDFPKYPHPAVMNDYRYFPTNIDVGGVHWNSGIQNHAAYLIATELDELGMDGKDILGKLSYDVLVNRLMPTSTLEDSSDAFVSAAEDYVTNENADPLIIDVVLEAWESVGLPYGDKREITSVSVQGASTVWMDRNSMSAYVRVPVGTNLTSIEPEITVSPGATFNIIDGNFSDGVGSYAVESDGTLIKWKVYIASDLPLMSYTSIPFVERDTDVGEVDGEITIHYNVTGDHFNGELGEDFVQTDKIIIAPVPEGLEAHAILVGSNELRIGFTGQADHHTNRDDIDNLSIELMEYGIYENFKYEIENMYKTGFSIDFKHTLELVSNTDTTVSLEWPQASNANTLELHQSDDQGATWSIATTASPIQPGSTDATITGLTANGQYQFKLVITGGEDAGESVQVGVVTAINNAPQVVNQITDKSATAGGADVSVSLANVFADSDVGDILTYIASSSAPNVATVSVTGDILTMRPLVAGSSTITVTANDGHGHAVSTSFTLSVKSSGGSYSGGGGGSIGPVTSTNGKITVPVGQSGKVSLGTDMTITIPAGASSKELSLTIERLLNEANVQTGKENLASPIYEILKNFLEKFSKPVSMTFTFDPKKVNSDQRPAVFYFDEGKKIWVEITGGIVNGNQITIEVDHLTKFVVLAVDINAKPDTSTDTSIVFSDIASHWAEASIKLAVQNGLVKGYSDGTFKPNGDVTRAEFVVMLMKALKAKETSGDLKFNDAAEIGEWAKVAITQAVEQGIINGYKDGTFRPTASITRAEIAVMIANILKLKVDANAVAGFADDKSIPTWAKSAVAAVKRSGIMQGQSDNQFTPNTAATRAVAVTILNKLLELK
ncbi:S-layer homology domain-containing protein [Cohnella sp. WQ 127256]|uniref:S-layer homology domain-containing protein n=1 Tax=Cohnella sp. WQ 127256 TaxID=2938790 RepID=UPI002119A3C6|nr:S-layer homology domain-containing protein [Cohnella sp. WQ 127256]